MERQTSWVITLMATTFLCAPSVAVSASSTLDAAKAGAIPPKAFVYEKGTESDYNFIEPEVKAGGKLNNQYYKIVMLDDKLSLLEDVSWEKVSAAEEYQEVLVNKEKVIKAAGTVTVELPNNDTQYLKYNYTKDPNREQYIKQLSLPKDPTGRKDIVADFVGISAAASSGSGLKNARDNEINSVTGDFVHNKASAGSGAGAAIYNMGTIGEVTGNFVDNYVGSNKPAVGTKGEGGAIYNASNAKIGKITGSFIGNTAGVAVESGGGGAIYNGENAEIDDITGQFIGNKAGMSGGAILNLKNAHIGNITADFVGNRTSNVNGGGGAIYNSTGTKIDNITGNFVGNSAMQSGGAIHNSEAGGRIEIGNITGDFIANSAGLNGGAIHSSGAASFGKITGDFINNKADGVDADTANRRGGGAISVGTATFDEIDGDFIGNSTAGSGGAIFGGGSINKITGDFIGNSAGTDGGAILKGASGTWGEITGDFINNHAVKNGGAVYSDSEMTFSSNGETHFMSGNYTKSDDKGKAYNAIYGGKDTSEFTFDTTGGGVWVVNDSLINGKYNFIGDDVIDAGAGTTSQYVAMNNDIVNAGAVTVDGTTLKFRSYQHDDQTAHNWDGKGAFAGDLNADGSANHNAAATASLTLNKAVFDLANGYKDTVKLKGYSATDSFLHVDVNPDNMTADELHINGDVKGVTKMIVHSSSDTDIRGKGGILFAQSENDTTGNADSFVVSRVYRSPYLYDVKYISLGSNANQWDLVMNDDANPNKDLIPFDPKLPEVPGSSDISDVPGGSDQSSGISLRRTAPEVVAYQALPVAALEQTRGMIGNVDRQVQGSRVYCPSCGFYDYSWDGKPINSTWVNAVYYSSKSKAQVDVDADVWGLEAGGTLQQDLYNKLGLFVSYRKGSYDMSGKGKYYYSPMGSEIDIDSYLAGLYYRRDSKNWWAFATLYGGIQKADLKTEDGITSSTDGTEFGGNVELGYDYALNKTLYVTPSAGLFYTQVNYDDAKDSAGKIAKYASLRQLEAEFGVKLSKKFEVEDGYANVYVRPVIIQTFNDGGDVRVTGLRSVNTLKNQTLGRIEIGGRYGFSDKLSAYGWANYTFGSDYDAASLGMGASYNL